MARRPRLVLMGAAALLMAMVACSESTPTDPRDVEFHEDLGVDLDAMTRMDSGLYYQDLEEGEGEVAATGDAVAVEYRAWLSTGALIDQSRETAFQFRLGTGQVILGWEEGIPGMREGGERLLVVPPNLAYGPRGLPGQIPGDATLVFRVTLVEVFEDD